MADKTTAKTKESFISKIKSINFAMIKKNKAVNFVAKFFIYFLLICIGFVYLEPLLEMISKSIMTADDLIDPSITWIAKHLSLENIQSAVTTLEMPGSMINSIWFSGLLAVAQTAVSATTGFALSRYTFRGRSFWFGMLIVAFILPVPLLTVPRIMMFGTLKTALNISLVGTIWPQFLMALLGQGTYSTMLVLIFYNFFNMIPKSLDEAAMIDGAGSIKVFYHIAIRLSASTILVVFLFAFVFNWNETYTTGTFLRSAMDLLPIKLSTFDSDTVSSASDTVNEAQKMAATLISIIPLLILYALVQKQFIEGIENTGITGE